MPFPEYPRASYTELALLNLAALCGSAGMAVLTALAGYEEIAISIVVLFLVVANVGWYRNR